MWRRFPKPAIFCVSLFAISALVRLGFITATSFDGLYGQDAFAYFAYARILLQATRALHAPPQFTWPLGYPALIAMAFALVGASPLAAQLVSLLTGALVAPLVYLVTRHVIEMRTEARLTTLSSTQARSDAAALVAGLVAATSGQMIQSSIVIMADAPATFWAVLSAWTLLQYARTRAARWWFASALTLLFAILTRWLYGALLVPWTLIFLYIWWHSAGSLIGRVGSALKHGALALLCTLPIIVIQWNALVPSAALNHPWIAGWNLSNIVGRSFDTPDGHFNYALPVGVFYGQPLLHPFYLFPLLLPLLMLGIWSIRRSSAVERILLIGWPLSIYLFLMGIPYENFRFGLALWPPLVVLTSVGFDCLWKRLGDWRVAPLMLGGLIGISVVGMLIWTPRGLDPIISTKTETLAVVRAVASQIPSGSSLMALGLGGFIMQYEPDLNYIELYNQNETTLERYVCGGTSHTFLLIDPHVITTQWANLAPDLNVRYLREQAGLTLVRNFGALTLFRIGESCA